jgi:PST family polysaccharide transporter/lipopolysaccharide exporter
VIGKLRRYAGELRRRLVPDGTLAEQTAKSGLWALGANGFSRLFTILMFVLLARILSPAAFGVYGIAILVISGVDEATTTGVREALIQREEENVDSFLNTAWVLELLRGLLVGGVLFLVAPFAASVFNEPGAASLLRLMGLGRVLLGFRNPGIVYFHKSLDFHGEFVYRVSSSFVMFAVALVLAHLWESVWALGVAYVVARGTEAAVSYVAHGYRPWPQFDTESARQMLGYGKWINSSSVLYFLYDRGDDALIAWLLSSAALGYYQFAYRLSNAPATEVSRVVSDVMFPTFSRLQDDPAALRDAFLRSLQLSMAVTAPMAFGLIVVAPTFVRGVLGEQWIPMIPVLQLLAVFGLFRSITTPMGALWRAIGRPDYGTKTSFVRVVLMAVLLYPATVAYGIEGTAATIVVITFFPILPLSTYFTVTSIGSSYRNVLIELLYPALAAGAMALAVVAVRESLPVAPSVLTLGLLVVVGIVGYVGAVAALTVGFDWEIDQNLKWIVDNVAS